MEKINLAHLITAWQEGVYGGERVVLNLASSIDRSKFNVVVVAFGKEEDRIPLLKAAKAKNIPVDTIPSRKRYDVRGIFDVKRMIRKHKIDIIHCHGYKSDVLSFFAALFSNVKLVTTLHGWWIGTSLKSRTYNALDLFVIRFFDKVIVVSQSLFESLISGGHSRKKTILIPNCVDVKKFEEIKDLGGTRDDLGVPKEATLLGTVSRLTEEKGHTYLIDAFAKILRKFNNSYLIIAGEGPLEGSLRAKARDLGLAERVIFTGFREDVAGIIAAMDIFLMPSISEGLPMAVLEAMAARKPIIASNVGGIPSVIHDKETGLIIEPGDPDSIVEAVTILLKDKILSTELANNAAKFVGEKFSLSNMVSKYEEVYIEAISK